MYSMDFRVGREKKQKHQVNAVTLLGRNNNSLKQGRGKRKEEALDMAVGLVS